MLGAWGLPTGTTKDEGPIFSAALKWSFKNAEQHFSIGFFPIGWQIPTLNKNM